MSADETMALRTLELGDEDGLNMGYVEWGPAGSARVVICVHGLTRNARDFDHLASALAERGARVIAVDIVGRGRSSWLSDPKNYAVPTYALHLARLLEEVAGGPVDWVGTSMGGILGMVLAATNSSSISRLIINDIGPFVPQAALGQLTTYVGNDMEFDSVDALETHLRTIHTGFGPLSDEQWHHLARHSAVATDGGVRLHYDPRIREPFLEMASADVDLWSFWDAITCPTYVLRGAESPILPQATAEQMTARGPCAEVVTLEGIGHAPTLMPDDQISLVTHWLGL